jgi:hypothetical protein
MVTMTLKDIACITEHGKQHQNMHVVPAADAVLALLFCLPLSTSQ